MIALIPSLLFFGLPKVLDSTYLSQHKCSLDGFDEIAVIDKVVNLEVTPDSALGYLVKVAIEPRTGELYTLDEDGSPLRIFSSTGKYLRTLGRMGNGPGELRGKVTSFCLGPDAVYVLTSYQVFKLALDGSVQRELDLSSWCHPGDLAFLGGTLYLTALIAYQKDKHDLLLFDQELRPKQGLLDFDTRKETYLFTQGQTLSTSRDKLYALQTYRAQVDVIDPKTQAVQSLALVQENASRLDALWAKPKTSFTEADRKEISAYLHRFRKIVQFGHKVLLFDFVKSPDMRSRMYEIDGSTVKVYDRYHFWNPDFRGKSLVLPSLPGSYQGGAIGQLERDKHFAFLEDKYPKIKLANHQADDNMLLVFFRPKPTN